jgi:Family of unknown function (DUF5946)
MQPENHLQYNELAFYTLALQDDFFIHQLVVDAYTAQTATNTTKPISLIFALVGLYVVVEKNCTGKQVQQLHTKMSNNKIEWPIIELPKCKGDITIDKVLELNPDDERNKMIVKWCDSVWEAYQTQRGIIVGVADYYL